MKLLKNSCIGATKPRFLIYGLVILSLLSITARADDEFTFTSIPEKEIQCLALNIYYEGRDQTNTGRVAIAFVTLNRVNHKWYPDTYCGVIQDGYVPGRRDCQFSWYCDGKSDNPKELKVWQEIYDFAFWFAYQNEYVVDPTEGATHYHSFKVDPWWSEKLKYNGVIDDHIFYTEEKR